MKKLLLSVVCAIISFNAFSQRVYLADTAFTTDVGIGGAPASCIFGGGNTYGWQFDRTLGKWIADAFTIPADSTWSFDTVIVYGYQAGSGTTSTFIGCNLEIYNGAPGLAGSSVIWGDTSTNVMATTGWTGMYRVDTNTSDGGLTQTTRPIMYLKLNLSPVMRLGAGTYWLACSATGSMTSTTSSPPKVLPGRVNPAGQQERQLLSGAWNYVSDNGHNTGMNMIIKASAAAIASLTTPNITSQQLATLNQNVPNPFGKVTMISFKLPQAGSAKLAVYNTLGQLVATLWDGETNAGEHQVKFNADSLPTGVYYCQLRTDSGMESKQMLLER